MTTMRVVGECFFRYRLTQVFPDKFHRAVKRLCVCVCACCALKVIPRGLTRDEELIVRQAFAGLCWSKQFYCFDILSCGTNGMLYIQLYFVVHLIYTGSLLSCIM